MPDPADTNALRETVWRHGRRATVVTIDVDLIESAADELDRLQEKLSQIASHPLLFAYTRDSVEAHGAIMSAMKWAHEEFDGTKRDRDRLRAVIENAPHTDNCKHVDWDADGMLRLGECTCWKADAL